MRRILVTVLMVLLASAPTTGVSAADGGPAAATAASPPTGQIVAVRGADDALWVASAEDQQGRWTSLGGRLVAVPAVARGTFGVVYVGIGTNGEVYARTWTTGWQRFSPPGSRCVQVAAGSSEVTHSELFLACLATNGKVYLGRSPGEARPLTRWIRSTAPPGLRPAGLALVANLVLALGAPALISSDRGPGTGPGITNVYQTQVGYGDWGPVGYSPSGRPDLVCATVPPVSGPYLTLCPRADNSLYWTYAVHVNASIVEVRSGVAAGRVIGKVGIAGHWPDQKGPVLGLGTNGQVYRWVVDYTEDAAPTWTGPVRFGGVGQGGVAVG